MTTRSLMLVSAGALLLMMPASASASASASTSTIYLPDALVAGPVLTQDGGVAVATVRSGIRGGGPVLSRVTLQSFAPGGRRVVTRRFPGSGGIANQYVDLGGSSSRLAFVRSNVFFGAGDGQDSALSEVAVGPASGPWSTALRCDRSALDVPPGASLTNLQEVAVSRNLVAFTGAGCQFDRLETPRIDVIDTTRAPASTVLTIIEPAATRAFGLRFAGRYLAWRRTVAAPVSPSAADSTYVVYDTETRRELYTVPDRGNCDLSERGVLVCGPTGFGGKPCPRDSHLTWYSPEAPTAHTFTAEVCPGNLRVVGDRVAVARRAGADRIELALVGLDGAVKRVAAFSAGGTRYSSLLDFDGRRIAWGTYGCAGVTLRVRALTASGPELGPPRTCPVAVSRREIPLTAGLRGRVEVSCPNGCQGALGLTVVGYKRAHASAEFVIPPDRGPRSVPFRLQTSRGSERRRLRRTGRLRVVASLENNVPWRRNTTIHVPLTLRAR